MGPVAWAAHAGVLIRELRAIQSSLVYTPYKQRGIIKILILIFIFMLISVRVRRDKQIAIPGVLRSRIFRLQAAAGLSF